MKVGALGKGIYPVVVEMGAIPVQSMTRVCHCYLLLPHPTSQQPPQRNSLHLSPYLADKSPPSSPGGDEGRGWPKWLADEAGLKCRSIRSSMDVWKTRFSLRMSSNIAGLVCSSSSRAVSKDMIRRSSSSFLGACCGALLRPRPALARLEVAPWDGGVAAWWCGRSASCVCGPVEAEMTMLT